MNSNRYEGRSLEDLKSSLRAVNLKIDDIRMEAAKIVGVLPLKPGRKFWVATEIDWEDSRLDHLREKYFYLLDAAYELQHITGKLEAEANNELKQWEVYNTIDKFLNENFNTFDEELLFFKKNNLTRGLSSLREKVLENPRFLQEVILWIQLKFMKSNRMQES